MLYERPPQREIARILLHIARNVTIIALAVFHLEKLPCAPCVAVPHKQLKHIITYDVVIPVRPSELHRGSGQIVGWFPLFRKVPSVGYKTGSAMTCRCPAVSR